MEEVKVVTLPDGTEEHYVLFKVGGRDDEGLYEYVLEGPAQGEKVYVEYSEYGF